MHIFPEPEHNKAIGVAHESMYLSLQHESEFEHLRFKIDNGVLNETGSERFPTTISKIISNTIDFNEDGKPVKLRFTCDAALLSSERPTNLRCQRRRTRLRPFTHGQSGES